MEVDDAVAETLQHLCVEWRDPHAMMLCKQCDNQYIAMCAARHCTSAEREPRTHGEGTTMQRDEGTRELNKRIE